MLAPRIKGLELTRFVKALCVAKGDFVDAESFAEAHYRDTPVVGRELHKAAVAGGTPDDAGLAPLTARPVAQGFIESLRENSAVDRVRGVPVPFNVPVPVETGGTSGAWVGAGGPIPVSKSAFETRELPRRKCAVMIPLAGELVRSMTSASEVALRNTLEAGLRQFTDEQFLNPSIAANGTVSPASITYGGIEVQSTGTDGVAIVSNVAAMLEAAGNMGRPTWVMRSLTYAKHAPYFPGEVRMVGGTLMGCPVIVTRAQATPPGSPELARYITLLDADGILVADEAGIEVAASQASALQMLTDATNSSAAPTPAQLTSLFQTGGAVVRVIREINWLRVRASAAIYCEVAY